MGKVTMMGRTPELMRYLHNKISALEDRVESDQKELKILRCLFRRLEPCSACNGYGELANHVDQDTTEFETCEACKGAGSRGGEKC